MNKTLIFAAVATAGMAVAPGAQAALAADAQLLMEPQAFTCPYDLGTPPACLTGAPVPQSNYFAMDINGDGIWADTERVAQFQVLTVVLYWVQTRPGALLIAGAFWATLVIALKQVRFRLHLMMAMVM